jgi:hypothetical protein
VQVAPEIDVVREQVCCDAKLFHSDKLIWRDKLIVLQPVPGRQLWMLLLCCGQRQQRHFSIELVISLCDGAWLDPPSPCSRAPTRWPSDDTFLAAVHESESGP